MVASFAGTAADQRSLRRAVATSPIILRQVFAGNLEALLADWDATRKSPDIDATILAWLASHAPRQPRRLDA